MNENLAPGDLAYIIQSIDGLSVGRIVQCRQIDGVHSQYGIVWLVSARENLISEYGAIGKTMHVPQAWLKKIMPPTTPAKIKEKELIHV